MQDSAGPLEGRTGVEEPTDDGPPAELELTEVLHALSDPIRLDLVRQLAISGVERSCGSFDLPIAKSTATHHFRVLRLAGVVSARVEGTRKFHTLRRAELDTRFPGLLDSIISNAPSMGR